MYLQDRRVLVITPRFFGYEQRIVDRLRERGAKVVFLDDRFSNSTLIKVLIRVCPWLIRPKLDAYHRDAIRSNLIQGFDDILFISPESCSAATVKRYREAFPDVRIMLYMWDSFRNKGRRNILEFLKAFDQAYSFDHQDCEKYGMQFRSLFFCDLSKKKQHGSQEEMSAFSFIGTIHSDRYKILRQLKEQADHFGQRHFIYPYLPSRLHYWLYKFTKREFRHVRQSNLRFEPLPYSEVLHVIEHSKAIVDIEHPDQRGLTMRTLEVIGSGRKLITTNQNVIDYPFYSSSRILVIDRKAPQIPSSFLELESDPIPAAILATYSLDGWLDEIFLNNT